MEDQDLLEIGILNSGHRQRILQAIQLLPKVSNAFLAWPHVQESSVQIWKGYWYLGQHLYILMQLPKAVLFVSQSDLQDHCGPNLALGGWQECHTGPAGHLQGFSSVQVLILVQTSVQAPQVTAQVPEDKINIWWVWECSWIKSLNKGSLSISCTPNSLCL